jgi:ketosteroid isomerase-like protein
MPETAIEIVRKFWEAMQTNDYRAAGECLGNDFVLEWPQSKERLRGRENFAQMNEEYITHGRWNFVINNLVGNEIEAVSDVTVSDEAVRARAITFSTIRNGKIIRQVEFWPEDYPAPENRRHLVEIISL